MQVVGRQLRLLRGAGTKRQKQMRPLVAGEYHRHRPLDVGESGVAQWPTGSGGVDDGTIAEQDQRVYSAFGHRPSQPHTGFPAHPGQVRSVGYLQLR
uniref:Uncharacterized protein n=1 Tax=Mycobacterium kansasii TaxID=1768 RepID=A0A653EQN5_MYCKA|nr:hypothetical protein BIN_B_02093 [Mycobacterium kansasii]